MTNRALAALFVLLSLSAARAAQDAAPPNLPKPQKEHAWLEQLAGEWTYDAEMHMAPDQPPVKSTGAESARMVGGFWLLHENKAELFGTHFHGVLTLGYDPDKQKYVGTWVDSMLNYLWRYEGTVDAAGKTLTLLTEGPSHEGPGKLARFKEVIEIKDKDHKVFTSSIEKDGKWVKMLTMTSTRKK